MQVIEAILRFLDSSMETPQPYGWFHLAFFALSFVAAFVLCMLWKKGVIKDVNRVVLVTAIIVAVLEVYKQINFSFEYENGIVFDYQWYAFSWQFCSTPLYIGLLAGISRGKLNNHLCSYLATYAFFAGFAVMCYPTTVFIRTIGICIQTMICHGSMITIAIFLYYTGHVKINFKTLLSAMPVFMLCMGVALGLNELAYIAGITETDTFNMFFISRHFDSTLPIYGSIHNALSVTPEGYIFSLVLYFVGFTVCAGAMLGLAAGVKALAEYDFDAYYAERDREKAEKEAKLAEKRRRVREEREREAKEKAEERRKAAEARRKEREKKKKLREERKRERLEKKREKEAAEKKRERLEREAAQKERAERREERKEEKRERQLREKEEKKKKKAEKALKKKKEKEERARQKRERKAEEKRLREKRREAERAAKKKREEEKKQLRKEERKKKREEERKRKRAAKAERKAERKEKKKREKRERKEKKKAEKARRREEKRLEEKRRLEEKKRKIEEEKKRRKLEERNRKKAERAAKREESARARKARKELEAARRAEEKAKAEAASLIADAAIPTALVGDLIANGASVENIENAESTEEVKGVEVAENVEIEVEEIEVEKTIPAYSEGLEFEKIDGTLCVVGIGICLDGVITIPEEHGGLPVREIGERAFELCDDVREIVIPESVDRIGMWAFAHCRSLERVSLRETVREIGSGAFDGCPTLKRIDFEGTCEQWYALKKDRSLNKDNGKFSILCIDGKII